MGAEDEKIKVIRDYLELIKLHPCKNWVAKLQKELEEILGKINGGKENKN